MLVLGVHAIEGAPATRRSHASPAKGPGRPPGCTGAIDIDAALKRRDAFTSDFDDSGQVDWLTSVDVALIRGHARITEERTIEVETANGQHETYIANEAVIIATGTGAAIRRSMAWETFEYGTVVMPPRRRPSPAGYWFSVAVLSVPKWPKHGTISAPRKSPSSR